MVSNIFYYMEESVLLGTKPLVDSIRHFIRDPSGVFSVYIHTYIHTLLLPPQRGFSGTMITLHCL